MRNLRRRLAVAVSGALDRLGEQCQHCFSRNTERHSSLVRGHNNHSNEPVTSSGLQCNRCHSVTWDIPAHEFGKSLPPWCFSYDPYLWTVSAEHESMGSPMRKGMTHREAQEHRAELARLGFSGIQVMIEDPSGRGLVVTGRR